MNRNSLKRYIRQTKALVEKDIYVQLYIKSNVLTRFLNPIISLFVFIFLFGIIFGSNVNMKLGYWNSDNYILFILIAFTIQLSRTIVVSFSRNLIIEKYWKTLSAIMIAPVNRYTLLFNGLISELIIISVPLGVTLIIALIFYPVSIIFLILTLIVFLLIYLFLASIGLIIASFGISNEKYLQYILIIVNIVMIFSCTNYPKEIFPEIIQFFILLNPLYYLFDLLRLTWYLGINYEVALSNITPMHIISLLTCSILTPIIAIKAFNYIYKKYGITGY